MTIETYIIIGAIIQMIIMIARRIRGVDGELTYEDLHSKEFMIGYVSTIIVGMAINIILWPISVVCEIVHCKVGV